MNLSDHPEIKRIKQEVEEATRIEEQQRILNHAEQVALRSEQGRVLGEQHLQDIQRYEELRQQLHNQLGVVWRGAQEFSRCTGQLPATFPESIFNSIDLPSLTHANHWSAGFSTTRAAVLSYFSTGGKWA